VQKISDRADATAVERQSPGWQWSVKIRPHVLRVLVSLLLVNMLTTSKPWDRHV